jgi:hypothetical protein
MTFSNRLGVGMKIEKSTVRPTAHSGGRAGEDMVALRDAIAATVSGGSVKFNIPEGLTREKIRVRMYQYFSRRGLLIRMRAGESGEHYAWVERRSEWSGRLTER